MTPILLAAIAGFLVGGFVGMVAIAIMCRGSDADDAMENKPYWKRRLDGEMSYEHTE